MYNILLYITFGCIRLVSRIPEIILVLWKLIPKLLMYKPWLEIH